MQASIPEISMLCDVSFSEQRRFEAYKCTPRPITSTTPANNYVGIDQSITYGDGDSIVLSSTAGIVDTGTTLILLATGMMYSLNYILLNANLHG